MVKNWHHTFIDIVQANQRAVTFSLLATIAFVVVAVNALFNQASIHPQPLWNTRDYQATGMIDSSQFHSQDHSVPVRKIKTTRFPDGNIPVPVLRPSVGNFSKPANKSAGEAILVDTATIQGLLRKLGFYNGPVDGLDGPQTKSAIKSFEKSKYLPERGDITSSLLLLLESAVERAASGKQNAGYKKSAEQMKLDAILGNEKIYEAPSQSEDNRLAKVDPAIITRVQVGLINYGDRNVNIDGVMGNKTKSAIERFQKRFDLEINGMPSQELVRKLESIGALTRG